MPSTIKIKIGDIITAVEWQSGKFQFDAPQSYLPFISEGRADITLALHTGAPEMKSGDKVFDSPPIWSLYRNGNAAFVHIFDRYTDLQRLLVLPPRFQQTELYFVRPGGPFINPFFGPTMELLMINYLAQGYGAIIHACGIADNGIGMLFAGESGAGKSTLANLWNRQAGAVVLSDDRTLVRQIDGHLYMYGTPWHGEAKFGSPRGVKLDKIFFLRHSRTNSIEPLSRSRAVLQLLQCSFPPYWDAAGMEAAMTLFERLATRVSCCELKFKPDESAIEILKRYNESAHSIAERLTAHSITERLTAHGLRSTV